MEKRSRRRGIVIGCSIAAAMALFVHLTLGAINLIVSEWTLTHGLKKEITQLEHVRHEFEDTRERDGLTRGRYVGVSEIDGASQHHVQFDDVLVGPGRVLDIQFPHERFDKATVREAEKADAGEPRAFLLMQKTCCLDQDTWYELFNMDVGDATSPVDLFENRFGTTLEDPPPEVFFAHLDFGNVFEFSTRWIHWKQGSDGGWEVVGRGSSLQQSYDLDVQWVKRDRAAIRRKKLGYAYTGTVDVVGWPVEILLLLAMPMGVV